MFSIRAAIQAFPDLLEELFVASEACSPEDVLAILHFEEGFQEDPDMVRVAGYLKACVGRLEENGECCLCCALIRIILVSLYLPYPVCAICTCAFLAPDLRSLLRCVTGSPYHRGNSINVAFSNDQEAFHFATCGSTLTISTRISDQNLFEVAICTLIEGREFTVP